ncbi:ATP-binding cassette domain-containing protein, partial [Nitrospirales bacterium NOB]|nr:ATP-binding cassette domain-containing protein [Nitrospirales bacterium NOB]
GKTTLLAQLTGDIQPDGGQILFNGRDITRRPAHARAHLGIARSYQIARLFEEIPVVDNVALAVQACGKWARCLTKRACSITELRERSRVLLERVGLSPRENALAGILSHGERRKLELAMALASRPKLLLLDEPLAGMGTAESAETVELLRTLRSEASIILVEHDISALFRLADKMSVLVNGKMVSTGTPEFVRGDPVVREAYFGKATELTAC